MAKKNEAAKLIREARRALNREARQQAGESQQALLRRARKVLDLTNKELAEALGVKPPTVYAYLAPSSASKHRQLPDELRAILSRILADHKAKRGS